jgi:hypothetical protein
MKDLQSRLSDLERNHPEVSAAAQRYERMREKILEMPLKRESLLALANHMSEVASETYYLFFRAGIGTHAHAFIEFCGVLNKYVDLCRKAAEEGVDFTTANVHTGKSIPVEAHDMRYLAEKMKCIFGPMLAANTEARRAFFEELGAYE